MGLYGHTWDKYRISQVDFNYIMEQEGDFLDALPDISPEAINEWSVYLESLSESQTILTEDVDFVGAIVNYYLKVGITGVNFGNVIKKTASDIGNIIKSEGINKEARKKIRASMDKFWEDMDKALNNMKFKGLDDKKFAGLDENKILKSMGLIFWVGIVNALVIEITKAVFGPIGAGIATAVIAPITEENAKKISIKGGFEKEFFVVFNAAEFTQYTSKAIMGNGLGVMPIITKLRLTSIGMHLTTTIIQWLTSNPKVLEKLNIKEEDDKNKASIFGHTLGVIIHSAWNGAAAFSTKFNSIMSKIAGTELLTVPEAIAKGIPV